MPPHPAESPAKKQSKWSAEEDALIIDLRGGGMKWEDISKRLPGRSAISCRLHYQNYLERRSEWDEERKNKLARLYERFKPEMWSKVAEEMAVPWRAAEAMHWQLGEADMARRAGVVPFSLSSVSMDNTPPSHPHPHHQTSSSPHPHIPPHQVHTSPNHRSSPPNRGHAHSLSSSSGSRYSRPTTSHSRQQSGGGSARSLAITSRRESTPRSVPPTSPRDGLALATIGGGMMSGMGRGMLPSVAEMTTGVSPYNTPAYTMGGHGMGYPSPGGGQGGSQGGYPSPGPMLPAIGMGMGVAPMGPRPVMGGPGDGKRRLSEDTGPREASRRRQ